MLYLLAAKFHICQKKNVDKQEQQQAVNTSFKSHNVVGGISGSGSKRSSDW